MADKMGYEELTKKALSGHTSARRLALLELQDSGEVGHSTESSGQVRTQGTDRLVSLGGEKAAF